ncbi:hypothetical protein [Streptomyces acidiscabies]|uniref:hypothetical protein n=1 Tax=Streptomyces acidiscabies TaxID=42234 RepID=UPI0038F6FF32
MLAAGALGAAASTLALALVAHGLGAGIALRALTGASLAVVYPVGMRLTASWAPVAVRGRAFGTLIAALIRCT